MTKRIIAAALAVPLALGLAACGGSPPSASMSDIMGDAAFTVQDNKAEADYGEDGAMGAETTVSGASGVDASRIQERKRVKTADLMMETKDFDAAANRFYEIAQSLGGFTQNQNAVAYSASGGRSLKNGSFTLRVPQENYEAALDAVKETARVVSSSMSERDRTADYYDAAARRETLLAQEERLTEMIARAETLEDIIALETRLSDVRYQIESAGAYMADIDQLAAMATINIELSETETGAELTPIPDDFAARMGESFMGGLGATVAFSQGAVIALAGAAVPLVALGMVALVVVVIVITARRRGANGV
ncbi:MAG: DUF4349 domain-containing protein [Clostridiales bacterium]|jgi:hypothetical protein|nr:DUF4349 domain-containing protein [Clostridiales bacterium]